MGYGAYLMAAAFVVLLASTLASLIEMATIPDSPVSPILIALIVSTALTGILWEKRYYK